MAKISDDQRKMFRQNQITLFALEYLRANRDEAVEAFGVLPNGFSAVEGQLLEFPSPAELDAFVEELARSVAKLQREISSLRSSVMIR